MIKKFCNLIDQDHFGDVNKVFVCKINENFIFETIFNVTPLLRLPKHTFWKVSQILVRLGKVNYTQMKIYHFLVTTKANRLINSF